MFKRSPAAVSLGSTLLGWVLLALAAGCGAAGTAVPADQPAAAALRGLPLPSELARGASLIETGLRCAGSEFRSDLALQNVLGDSTRGRYSPGPGSDFKFTLDEAAYAVYDFDLSLLDNICQPLRIEISTAAPPDPASHVFIGLGNPDTDIWHWGETVPEPLGWSWGETQQGTYTPKGGTGAGRVSPWLPVVVMVFGSPEMQITSIAVMPDAEPRGMAPLAFRTSWDLKTNRPTFHDSMDVERDGQGRLHFVNYDSSNSQLFHTYQDGRSWVTQAVDCDGDVGSSCDLFLGGDGSLLLPYYDGSHGLGALRSLSPDSLVSDLVWSPRSNFEGGLDENGLTIDAGAYSSGVVDGTGVPHIFYDDVSNGRIRHAWKPLGALEWQHDYVSPEGVLASKSIGLYVSSVSGMCCLYMADNKLFLAEPDVAGWTSFELAADVYNPLDPGSTIGFCDGSVFNTVLTCAYSGPDGGVACAFDLSVFGFEPVPISAPARFGPAGGGVFVDVAQTGDGSVRLAHYCVTDKKVYFETGDIPSAEQFSFSGVPAVQLGPDEDCDDLCFWASPDLDADGFHDAALGLLTKAPGTVGSSYKHKKTGHVSLLK